MSSYRSRGGHSHNQAQYRNFYDDRRSHSRSPDHNEPSPRRRSPPHDNHRVSQGPGAYRQHNGGEHGGDLHDGESSRDRQDHSYERRPRSPRRQRGGYIDPDAHPGGRRSRSRSASRDGNDHQPPGRGKPSREIMMEDLSPHLTENDILFELQQNYRVTQIDDVRIIRDRQTKKSRGFGFLRFASLEDAETFMDANHPAIYIYGDAEKAPDTSHAKIHLVYGRERKDADRIAEVDWMCKICNANNLASHLRCHRCHVVRADVGRSSKPMNVGDNDVSADNVPSQFLLFRGLEPSVNEELMTKGVAKLNKPPIVNSEDVAKKGKVSSTTGDAKLGAREGTLRRVLLVRDRKTDESWRYGFAEYASSEDAQAALTRYNTFDLFTIASKQVLVSYIHAGVFIPVISQSAADPRFTFSPLGNPSMRLAYWDEEAYVTDFTVASSDNVADLKMHEKGKITKRPMDPMEAQITAKKPIEKKRKVQPEAGLATNAKKVTSSHLQFWSNRHAELHGIQRTKEGEGSDSGESGAQPSRSYADPERNCCYLCMRKFNSPTEVNKHERLSDLHRQNLKNEARVQRAEHKLEKHRVGQSSTPPGSEYRDRARERRQIYGVVNKKGEQVGSGAKAAKPSPTDEAMPSSSSSLPPRAPVESKGAALLSKMGYTAGQGLGASGEGMTAPVSQDIYAAGVGLGAQGGKLGDAVAEAERNTKGDYGAFAEQTRERARERYSRM